ncbi:MAG: hypothetical protein Q7J33_04475 [Serpentinimonas sp.]|nr:hypothetical protein [Serpentinimonas sp.]
MTLIPAAQAHAHQTFACGDFVVVAIAVTFRPNMAKQLPFENAHFAHVDRELALGREGYAPPLAQLGFERRGAPAPTLGSVAKKRGGVESNLELPDFHFAVCRHLLPFVYKISQDVWTKRICAALMPRL